jgi:hypothetical protein
MIAITRQAMINDDMGALTAQAAAFGRMAGLSIEVDFYALLALNGGLGPNITLNVGGAGAVTAPLFDDTAWKNVSTGGALSVDNLYADRVKMASQKDINNNEFLSLEPSTLLLPLTLEGEAKILQRSATDPTIVAGNPTNRPNKVAGLFKEIVGTPRLTGTRRYIFADPGLAPAVVVAFLNGAQTPFMDQKQGWRIDGLEWKLRHDYKVQAVDPKGAITNAGV